MTHTSLNPDKLTTLLTDNIHATLMYTDSNPTFFTSSSFRNGADKHKIKKKSDLETSLENWIQEDKSYLVESACEIDNNFPSSVVINYLEFTDVTCRRPADTDMCNTQLQTHN